MATVKINDRRSYELYVKVLVRRMTISNKSKSAVRKLIMKAFDDGVAYNLGELGVEDVREETKEKE